MRFYTGQHQYYCGIDLHAHSMHICVLNQSGEVLLHRDLPAGPEPFLRAVAPYREGLAVECFFTWKIYRNSMGPRLGTINALSG